MAQTKTARNRQDSDYAYESDAKRRLDEKFAKIRRGMKVTIWMVIVYSFLFVAVAGYGLYYLFSATS